MSKKASVKPKLSFDLDEEEDDGGEFQVKKSKESRKFKKMRQAPGIAEPVVETVAEKTVAQELGGSYSAESLAKLRQAQLFAAAAKEEEAAKKAESQYEEMELCGEAAEEFVEMAERQAIQQNSNLGEYVGFDKANDLEAIQAGRLANKALLKGAPDRIYTSELTKSNKTKKGVAFDLEQDNDLDWEDEIIRRGVISKNTALSEENKTVTEKASRLPTLQRSADSATGVRGANGGSSSVFGEVAVSDLIRSVQLAVEKLSTSESAARRKIEQNANEAEQAQREESDLRRKVEIGVRKLNTIQDIKYFFASLVGMLRDKGDSFKELADATEACAKERAELLALGRAQGQEDTVYRLKEASLMVSLGSYTPTAIMAAASAPAEDSLREPQLDGFGRVKPSDNDSKSLAAALKRREDCRLRDRARVAEVLTQLEQSDRNLIIAARVSDTAVEKQRLWSHYASTMDAETSAVDLYHELEVRGGLYNAKGEEVKISEKLDTLSQATLAVVDDAQPELVSVTHILSMLEQFKAAYPTEYQAAYIGESVAELLGPLGTLDLVAMWVDTLRTANSPAAGRKGRAGHHGHGHSSEHLPSFKARSWFAPLDAFSTRAAHDHTAGAGAELNGHGKSASGHSMQSMAAQINNLFAEDEEVETASVTLLSQVADGVLLPWLRDRVLPTVDLESAFECAALAHLVKELQDLCSSKVAKGVTSPFVTYTERTFPEHAQKVCLPLLKIAAPSRGSEEQKTSEPGQATSNGAEFARAFSAQQLTRLTRILECGHGLRSSKLLRSEPSARCAWRALTEHALPSASKLMRVGGTEDKLVVLGLVEACLSLITGAQSSSLLNAGNTVHDGQLKAWQIPPAQFRSLLSVAQKLRSGLSQVDPSQGQQPVCVELFAELAQVLGSLA